MKHTTLQHEIGKRDPFKHPEEEAYLNLLRTMHVLDLQTQRQFKPSGLSGPTYNVLGIIRGHLRQAREADGKFEGLPCSTIAANLVTQVPDLTRLVDRLEKSGLVRRKRSDEDRRVVFINITRKGLNMLEQMEEPLVNLHRRQLGHLSSNELKTLSRLLVKARRPHITPS